MTTVDLRPAGRYEWEQIIRRARFKDVIGGSGKKGKDGRQTRGAIAPTTVKAVALAIASYGNDRGEEIWPGDATLAVDLECALLTVKTVKRALVRFGLLQQVAGRSAGRGQEYRLTIPVELLEALEVLTPAAHKLAAKKLNDGSRGKSAVSGGTRETDSPEPSGTLPNSPEDADSRYPEEPADDPIDESSAVSAGSGADESAVSAGSPLRYPPDSSTDQYRTSSTSTDHAEADVRTADSTSTREPAAQDRISSKGNGFCLRCHVAGQIVLAADPQGGSACALHLREPDWEARNRDTMPVREPTPLNGAIPDFVPTA